MRVHLAIALALCAGTVSAQIQIPPHSNTYNGFSRGFNFTANTDFFINQLDLPLDAFQAGDTAGYMVRVNGIEVLRSVGNAGAISVNIQIATGDVVDIIGNWSPAVTGNFTAHNSYGSSAPYSTMIEGVAHTLNRTGWQWDIGDASYMSGTYLAPTTGSMGRILVYTIPPAGLHSSFTATPTSGASPLLVQFADTTFTSDPAGVQTWAWDFDSNGTIDSTIQNPSWTYNVCGYFDVTLTTTDTMHPASTKVETAFITVDPQLLVTADFTANPTTVAAPGVVQFTDTSTGNPTTWFWDLDGDTVVDSTVQNPSFTYNIGGRYDVTLTAGNACGGHTVTKTQFITVVDGTSNTLSPEILQYQFNETRGDQVFNSASTTIAPDVGTVGSTTWQGDPGRRGFMGNEAGFGMLSYHASNNNTVDTSWPVSVSGSITIMFWARRDPASTSSSPFGYWFSDGSFRAFMGSAGVLLGNHGVISGTYTANFSGHLTPGNWHHYAIVIDDAAGTATWFEDGIPHASPASFPAGTYTYSGTRNLLVGASSATGGSRATAHFDMDDFRFYASARTQAEIQAAMAHEIATTSRYAGGCAGTSGVPVIGASGAPSVGNASFALTLKNAELARGGLLVLGVQSHTWLAVVPLPFDLSFLFGPGCGLQTGLDVLIPINTGSGSMSVPFPIPAGYAGSHGYAQFLILGTQGAVTAGLDINIEQP